MRGAVLTGPEAVEIRDLPVEAPGRGELLLKVGAATTCGTDVKVFKRGGHPRMLQVPTLFGHEMAGQVAFIGDGVSKFGVGDRVVVANSAPCTICEPCLIGRENLCEDLQYLNGAFAEFVRVPARFVERSTYVIPDDLTFERAALTEPLACVLHGLSACELDRYGARGPVDIVLFGGGPIGLMFVAALALRGHRVILADPNPGRLEVGLALGASGVAQIGRGGGQIDRVRAALPDGAAPWIAIDATGVPEVWQDAIEVVRPGGLVNLFGGCAPGTSIPLDTHRLHYSEVTVKGVYHHRPETVKQALVMLSDPEFKAELLLSGRRSIDHVEDALRAMIAKDALKIVITGADKAQG
jgi:L-iditol 2-dehydrogenase